MRICIRLLAFTLAIASPLLLRAQFQEPTADELKMTSDPKAPGADAVYLYREEKTDDLLHFHTLYARIKVLTEKGKELATVRIPYEHGQFQVAAIEGRTIHADGTIIKLTAKPSDLLDLKSADRQFNRMVFTLPAAEVGSILEYRLQLRYSENTVSSPHWIVQQPYFVHKAHYFFDPEYSNKGHMVVDNLGEIADGLMYSSRLGIGDRVVRDSMNRFSLDMTDIPALPDEDWAPPLNKIRWSVVFYYTSANSQGDYWASEGKFWTRNVDRFASPSGAIKKAVSDIVSAGDSEEARARKIYAAVIKLENRDFSRAGASHQVGSPKGPRDAAAVWKQQIGTSDEIALLFVALARTAGLKVWPMQVVDRDRAFFEPTYLSIDQFDDYIAILDIDGKPIYVDPGQKVCPFGSLHWKHQLASGIRLTPKGTAIEETPAEPPKAALVERSADLTLDDHGAITGTIRLSLSGQEALAWRQFALVSNQEQVGKEFNDWIHENLPEGVNAALDHFGALDDPQSSLVATAKVSGTLGSVTGKRFILPASFFEARGKHPFVEETTRSLPIDLHFAAMEQDQVTYHFSAGIAVDTIPRPADVGWTGHASLKIAYAAGEGSVAVTRGFVRNSALMDASDYGNLRATYLQIGNADRQQIVLTRASSGEAN